MRKEIINQSAKFLQAQRSISSVSSLLIDEGFESDTFPPQGWLSVIVEGSPDWVSSAVSPHSGNYAAYNEWGPSEIPSKKYLITKRVSLNGLLQYRLSFWMKRGFVLPFEPDTVYIKLSITDSLPANFTTTLYKCYTGPDTSTDPDIYTTTYKKFNVDFTGSGTVWLAFDHEDTDGQSIDLDDVQLEEIVNNDITAYSLDEPSQGSRINIGNSFQPKATFKNIGVQTQTNIPVRVRFYGTGGSIVYNNLQTIATLAPNTSIQVTFSTYNPTTPDSYTARAIAQNPGDTDPSNDSTEVQFSIPDNISGVKTVGTGGNFTTLAEAIRYLNANNVAGPLTFSLISSSYTESPLTIEQIHYTTTQQTVVIKPSGGLSPTITITPTPSNPFCLRVKATSNFTLDGSNSTSPTRNLILNTDTSGYFGPYLLFTEGSKNLIIKNTIIKGYSISDGSCWSAIILENLTPSEKDSNIVFDNLQILRAFDGISLQVLSLYARKATISNCNFGGPGIDALVYAGISAADIDSILIFNNDINGLLHSQGYYGIYGILLGRGCTNAIVHSNKINSVQSTQNNHHAYGIVNDAGAGSNLLCYNNQLSNIISKVDGVYDNISAGIYSSNPLNTGERYFYNSIYLYGLDSSSSPNSHSAGFYIADGVTNIQIMNNIVMNSMTFTGNYASNKAYCVYMEPMIWPSGSTSNYNDFFASGPQGAIGFIGGTTRNTLSEWRSGSLQDVNSISADPLFVSDNDLHIQTIAVTSPVDARGTPIAGITTDIDRENRDASTPDIGADEFSNEVGAIASVRQGWNMISLSLNVTDPRVTTLFPQGLTPYAFSFGNGYVEQDSLFPGIGYWLKFSASANIPILGTLINSDTIDVIAGWNLIGSVSSQILATSVTTVPGDLLSSSFFGYNNVYLAADTLYPFKGYWIKTTEAGKIVLAKSGSLSTNAIIRNDDLIKPKECLNYLVIQDAKGYEQKLYFGINNTIDEDFYELPPVPPEGGFDARFISNKFVAVANPSKSMSHCIPVIFSSAAYPVKVEWSITEGNNKNYSLTLANGETVSMNKSTNIIIANNATNTFNLNISTDDILPKEYSLYQNYPNPFNPSTMIKYSLPSVSHVQLKIFNMLGQEIAQLIDQDQEAGYHELTWQPNVASGIYFYSFNAADLTNHNRSFKQLRKMLFIQ